ncbi:MAG TPA: DUF5714 domain-containing protein [Methanocorpusculum sp.]|nr:DUF5714 domain-containing protein [Methanocorpusculum sp.]
MVSENCIICGDPLIYSGETKEAVCEICGRSFPTNTVCSAGHFVCDECHANPGTAVSTHVCLHTDSKNPVAIAQEIMANPAVHMHGPEHHIIVGQALLAAYKNAGGEVNLPAGLTAVAARGRQVPGGFCGLAGNCGAAVSAGIFLSVALHTTPLSKEAWALGMKLTSRCLAKIAEYGGPRCCKRDSFTAILESTDFVREHPGIEMEMPQRVVCTFSERNGECLKEKCPYYR